MGAGTSVDVHNPASAEDEGRHTSAPQEQASDGRERPNSSPPQLLPPEAIEDGALGTSAGDHHATEEVNISPVHKLLATTIEKSDSASWSLLWSLPDSCSYIESRLSFTLIRSLRVQNSYNYAALIVQLIERLDQLMDMDPELICENPGQALNCVRILSRLVPVMFERHGNSDRALIRFLLEGVMPKRNDRPDDPPEHCRGNPPGFRMMMILLRLLFVRGFTLPEEVPDPVLHDPMEIPLSMDALVWEGATSSYRTASLDKNRTELLKCFLACFSYGMFQEPDEFRHDCNPLLELFINQDERLSATFLSSLLCIVATYEPFTVVPYSYALFENAREPLVELSLHCLLVLLDFRTVVDVDSKDDEAVVDSEDKAQSTICVPNLYLDAIVLLSGPSRLQPLFKSLTQAMSTVIVARRTYLPKSAKQCTYFEEAVVLFWKLLESNRHFCEYVSERAEMKDIVTPILFLMCHYRPDASKVGLVHTCCLILLRLSSEREFSIRFNEPCAADCPIEIGRVAPGCTMADVLVLTMHRVITQSADPNESLQHVLLTVLANISPYMKALSLPASLKLMSLVERFASAKFLYSAENNYRYIQFLLECMNNIIQYQLAGNARLLYAITQRAKLFFELGRIPEKAPVKLRRALSSTHSATASRSAQRSTRSLDEDFERFRDDSEFVPTKDKVNLQQEIQQQQRRSTEPRSVYRFIPTVDWIESWKKKLPLSTIYRMLEFVLPRMNRLAEAGHLDNEARVVEFFQGLTLVGVLPLPHSIIVRRYRPAAFTDTWFSSYIWGCVFLSPQNVGLFDQSAVRLFTINDARLL